MTVDLADQLDNNEPGVLRDLLNGVAGLARDSMTPTIVPVAGMPPDMVAYFYPGEKELKILTVPQPPVRYSVDSLESLATLARQNAESVLWYDRKRLTLAFRPAEARPERRESAELGLRLSPQFDALEKMAEGKGGKFEQKELIHFLRVVMHDCLDTAASQLLLSSRSVKFQTKKDNESSIEHGKTSIGKALTASVAGASDIPDQIVLAVPTWLNDGCEVASYIKVAVDIDAERGLFVLSPLGSQIEYYYQRGLAYLIEQFASKHGARIPCLAGRPY